jgi:hypothetical protein
MNAAVRLVMFPAVAIAIAMVAGCGKTEVPDRARAAPPSMDAPKVAPVVPKAAEAPSPVPGQANDHSNPAFKGGGKNDPSK